MFDLILKGGGLYGTGRGDGLVADLAVQGARIAGIGRKADAGRRVIDVSGLAVAPGFIDVHSHSDNTLLVDGCGESKVHQGVTTEVTGNCGVSAFPLLGAFRSRIEERWKEYGIEITWEDLEGYEKVLLGGGISLNVAPLTGHGNLRGAVVGYEGRRASPEELERMASLLNHALQGGAFGLSTGLIYPPGIHAAAGELAALAKGMRAYGGVYTTHMRSETGGIIEALREAIWIGEEAGVGVQVSHLKLDGKENLSRKEEILGCIESARARGVDVTADAYPYSASCTDLDTVLPRWAYRDGVEREMALLRDPSSRRRILAEMKEEWERIMVSSVSLEKNRRLEGKRISELAREMGKSPGEVVVDLVLEERAEVGAVFFFQSEEGVREVLKKPFVMVASDSSARSPRGILGKSKVHPRTYGTFPRLLGPFVRDGVLSLPEAVDKMTRMPAERFGIPDRGVLREGACADLVVFDPARVRDTATYETPHRFPEGILYVLVNGEIVVERGAHTGARPGRLLRKTE